MSIDHIIIVTAEPNSIFLEILFKYFTSTQFKKNKKKITIIGNILLINKEIKKKIIKLKLIGFQI